MKKITIYVGIAVSIMFLYACTSGQESAPQDTQESKQKAENFAKYKKILSENSVYWTRLGWPYHPPMKDENGKARMMLFSDKPEQKFHADMQNAGIKIHSTIIFSGWVSADEVDFTAVDETLDKLFASVGKDAYYIPRIKLDPPVDWCKKNPEDVTVYYPAKLSKEEIVELVGSAAHDWFGIELDSGYTTDVKTGGKPDPRKNQFGLIGMQSFSSEKWLSDASEVLRKLIRHIENSKYGKQIIGYHFAYGQWGETSFWRGWVKGDYRLGDYGINNLRAFYDWGIKKYGSRDELAKAWQQPNISRENVNIPTPMKRELHWNSTAEFFRASPDYVIVRDYEKFSGEVNAKIIDTFARVVKEESDKTAGAFYGYYMYVPRATYNGHVEYDKVLNSKYLDFIASPKGYRHVNAGDSSMEQVVPMSINLKKYFIDELDIRTHLSKNKWDRNAENMDESRTIIWREFVKCMMSRSGFWWMALHGGWFDSPEILAEIRKTEDVAKLVRAKTPRSTAEVLVVSDSESFYYSKPHWLLHRDLLNDSLSNLMLSGAHADHYRLSDLENIDLTNYKAVFFLNCTRIEPKYWQKLSSRLRSDATLIWHHSPAVWQDKYDPIASEKITGFRLIEQPACKKIETLTFTVKNIAPIVKDFSKNHAYKKIEAPYPTFSVEADNMEVIARYSDNSAAIAKTKKNGRTNYFIGMPVLRIDDYRRIIDDAKVNAPAPKYCVSYGDNRIMGIFSRYKVEFPLVLKGTYKDIITGKTYKQGDKISLRAKDAIVLLPVD